MSDDDYEYDDELDALTAFLDEEEAAYNPYDEGDKTASQRTQPSGKIDEKDKRTNDSRSLETKEESTKQKPPSSLDSRKVETKYEDMGKEQLLEELRLMRERVHQLESTTSQSSSQTSSSAPSSSDTFADALFQGSEIPSESKKKQSRSSQFDKCREKLQRKGPSVNKQSNGINDSSKLELKEEMSSVQPEVETSDEATPSKPASKSFRELFSGVLSSDDEDILDTSTKDGKKQQFSGKSQKKKQLDKESRRKAFAVKKSPPSDKESLLRDKFLTSFSSDNSDEEDVKKEKNSKLSKADTKTSTESSDLPGTKTSFYKTSEKKRVANVPSSSQFSSQKHAAAQKTSAREGSSLKVREERNVVKTPGEDPWVTEKYSRIRISNPVVSMAALNERLKERKMIRLAVLKSHIKSGEVDGDWVTMGVIVSKVPPKTGSNGKQFSIWKLNDLSATCPMVACFLFGQVHEDYWKTVEGSVVGILNAKIMAKKDQQSDEICINVDNPQKLLILGRSKDLGMCKSKKKNGTSCKVFVNKAECEYCEFHIQKEYKKMSSKRADLMTSYSGIDLNRPNINKAIPKNFINNGRMYNVGIGGMRQKTYTPDNKKVVLKKLTARHASDIKKELRSDVVTLHAKRADEDDTQVKIAASSKQFKDMMMVPTPGAQNLIRHMVKDINAKEKLIPISASDLMKQHKQNMKQKIKSKQQMTSSQKSKLSKITPSEEEENTAPCLGRGFQPGEEIDLEFSSSVRLPFQKNVKLSAKELAKMKAVALVRKKGSLDKVDPNESISKKPLDENKIQAIMKRTQKNLNSSLDDEETSEEPAPKRRRFLGGFIDLNSEELQEIYKAQSINFREVAVYEREKQEEYFNTMEKTEKMELKMAAIMEKECKVVSCKKCDYTWFKASQLCKDEGHEVKYHDSKLRYFKCKDCKSRCISFFLIPTKFCRSCGGGRFERVSMLKEKKVPERECEKLLIRGEERKWVNK